MPWGTARSNAASAVCRRGGGACTGGCGRAGQVVCGGCGDREGGGEGQRVDPGGRRSIQSPTSVQVASPGDVMGLSKLKFSLRWVREGWWGAGLGAAAGLGRWFVVRFLVLLVCGDFQMRRQHLATTAHRALPVCEWPTLDMPWGTAR